MKRLGKFIKDALVLTIFGIVIRIIATVFNVYLSNVIGTEAIGIYQLLMSVYLFCINIAVAGMGLTTIKLVSKEDALGNSSKISRIVQKVLLYSGTMGCVACLLLVLSGEYLVTNVLNNVVSKRVIFILAISLPFLSMSYALNGYFTGKRKIFKGSMLQLLDQIAKVIVMTILIIKFLPGSIENACIALVLGDTICEVLSFILSYALYKLEKNVGKVTISQDKQISKEIIGIAFPVAFTACIRSGLNALKQVTIPKSLEKSNMSYKAAISEYGVVTGLAMPIITFMSAFIQPVSSLLLPQFSAYHAKGYKEKVNSTIDRVFKTTLFYAIGVMGALWAFSEQLGEIIYNNSSVGWYIKMLSPLVIFMYLDSTVDSMLRGLDKQIGVMLCNILDLVVSIAFIYFVVPKYGVAGYIASIFLSTILNACISIGILIYTTHFRFRLSEWVLLPCIGVILSRLLTIIVKINMEFRTTEIVLNMCIFSLIYFLFIYLFNKIINVFKQSI